MRVTALAGGVGAGKFLRGLVRAVPAEDVTVIVNTGDDIVLHGLHVSPDVDSVTYWLAGVADRERGWGMAGETFRAKNPDQALKMEFVGFGNMRQRWIAAHGSMPGTATSMITARSSSQGNARRYA